jgi:hypothetical protein
MSQHGPEFNRLAPAIGYQSAAIDGDAGDAEEIAFSDA